MYTVWLHLNYMSEIREIFVLTRLTTSFVTPRLSLVDPSVADLFPLQTSFYPSGLQTLSGTILLHPGLGLAQLK